MQGRKNFKDERQLLFSLSAHVPEHNFYRRLKARLDLTFLYELTAPYYGKCGQQSIDPVVFFKLCLISYLENIVSDRKLIEHCSLRLDLLYFLDYQLDEPLPWHSTVSRTRKLYPERLFETLFDKVFSLCVEQGMVSGSVQAIDSAPIKANASMESPLLKQPQETGQLYLTAPLHDVQHPKNNQPTQLITAPAHQLRKLKKHQQNLKRAPTALGANHEKAQLVSNKTHYAPHDPDARISVKPGKARKLNYHCSMAVDTAQGVISHIQADFADGRDSQYLPNLTEQVQSRLLTHGLLMQDLLADAGYSNGSNYYFLELRGITAWIPVFGMYKPEINGFPYDKKTDQYTCPMGKALQFKSFDHTPDGRLLKHYWAAPSDCRQCPSKPTCAPKTRCRKITRTAYDEHYQRAFARQHSKQGNRMKKLRQSTIEPVFGSLVQHYGLRKINVLGKSGAHKVMLLAAVAFNLKKYMKCKPVRAVSMAQVLEKEALLIASFTFLKHYATQTAENSVKLLI
ncbi:IS1182 family transposase [Pontibacter sp. BT310]|uniref:IS1182 family transposase n=1 Tax=Pontibacter populi TaxID=890055 RepID=A0ABS6XG18_9BACT|nr:MULTISPECIES: IS1182 family transposase [Pontibacter]MBJ6120074.1 IS1182 family transposase [Pontibacter sp. BT310]MBR0572503.1 IS1182 family transposase [Microvirga sp. STS03]MBW3366927.1 IS1182 family transposase [Pontibacter populi]